MKASSAWLLAVGLCIACDGGSDGSDTTSTHDDSHGGVGRGGSDTEDGDAASSPGGEGQDSDEDQRAGSASGGGQGSGGDDSESMNGGASGVEPGGEFQGVLSRPRQVLAGHACQNNADKWSLADGREANVTGACALTVDNRVDCYLPNTEDENRTDMFGSGEGETIVDLTVWDSVAVLDSQGVVSTWDLAFNRLVQLPGFHLAVVAVRSDLITIGATGQAQFWAMGEAIPPVPVSLPGIHRLISVSDSGAWCSIDNDNEISCRDRSNGSEGLSETLTTPPEGQFVQLSVADSCACAIREDSQLECWTADPNVGEWDAFNGTEVSEVSVSRACDLCFREPGGDVMCWRAGRGTADAMSLEPIECQLSSR